MRRVLLTGMSGSGKSTLVEGLRASGHRAVDLEDEWCEPTVDGRRRWRVDAVRALLRDLRGDALFVAGCEENMGEVLADVDLIVLLTAPLEILLQRVSERTGNPFGHSAEQRARIAADVADTEPRLRRLASHVIDTTCSPGDVLREVLLVTTGRSGARTPAATDTSPTPGG